MNCAMEGVSGRWVQKLKFSKMSQQIIPNQVILGHGDFAQFNPFPGEGGKPTFTYLKVSQDYSKLCDD